MDQLINPTKHSFYFRLSERDCYKVRTGRCSLDLSDEEFKSLEGKEYEYALRCRRLAAHYIKPDMHKKHSGIFASINACGHISFSDGQHRMCICKRSGVTKLLVYLSDNGDYVCHICQDKNKKLTAFEKLKQLLFNKSPRKLARENDFIDDEFFD
ncbi:MULTISPECIES: hypothetical protein [Bacillus]|uniref:hypothetical protein n=1 Tax=Bacillus TaxID=1386 RepID=UPI0006173BC6|nr:MULTISPECIES: hypothetical protein [Bacillus]KKB71978.1 hypothetical protein TH62_20490 [Bacillus sp. TH008]MDU0072094.1 hypothetical protein [Bacillus sp. IG6]MED8019647.1 hypothetical protein [Bacillus glycinifermentans]WKB79231.1 hypothetical protein QYM22_10440 [Bacillus glycinifermentans]SCA85808.1 hypothetical protein BGLY_1985 [Bacillus glycinifermentans]